jgi:hypothetical protein
VSTIDPSTHADIGLRVLEVLAEWTLVPYLGRAEHSTPTSVLWRDQNASHLMVLAAGLRVRLPTAP